MFADSGQRRPTNVPAIYFCVGFVILLLGLVSYTAVKGDVRRITRGFDDCGNICGVNNPDSGVSKCGNPDKREFPFTKTDITTNTRYSQNELSEHSECVKSCKDYPGYEEFGNRCFKTGGDLNSGMDSLMTDVAEDLTVTWPSIALSCGVAVIFSYILLILFRYAANYVIWTISLALLVVLGFGSVGCLVGYVQANSSNDQTIKDTAGGYMFGTIFLAILLLLEALLLYLFRKRIRLVSQLFKESSKVLMDLPLTIFEPILTFVALAATFFTTIYFLLVIGSSGDLKVVNDELGSRMAYQPSDLDNFTFIVTGIGFIWFTTFIVACQNFVIASTVSQWFFTRNKNKLDSPIKRAFSHLIRFHIGSICLGSIFITIVKIIRQIVENLKNDARNPIARLIGYICAWIMRYFEEFMKYLARNAYIIVALNGTPLIESGKKALRLITSNLLDVIAINRFGDFVLGVGKLFVALISGCVCHALIDKSVYLNYSALPIIIAVIFAFLIVQCVMTVFEMTIDTIFVCFCEDCEVNDGFNQPFFMSRELMEVMQEMKTTAGGQFTFRKLGAGEEAGQPLTIPAGWKFGNEK